MPPIEAIIAPLEAELKLVRTVRELEEAILAGELEEMEKLTQMVRELEEAILAGGAAANIVRDYERRMQELNEEKKILDRELARAKISTNRVAVVIANDWKDVDNKVMPVKQWLDTRGKKSFRGMHSFIIYG
ncbi:putative microtubule-associated protein [Helianthus anomalus]